MNNDNSNHMIFPRKSIFQLQEMLSKIEPRNRSGERFEEILSSILPNAIRLPKDKKWFDIKLGSNGIECKTYLFDEIFPNASTHNVLKRVSIVESMRGNKLRTPSEVGMDLIDYLHTTISKHAIEKGITGDKIMAILARGKKSIDFAYWEEPLNFGNYTDYKWSWIGKGTLIGDKNGERIFDWYQNQKQLFYRWKIPTNAIFFKIPPFQKEISRSEFIEEIKKSYLEGYNNGIKRRPPKY